MGFAGDAEVTPLRTTASRGYIMREGFWIWKPRVKAKGRRWFVERGKSVFEERGGSLCSSSKDN